MSAPHQYQGTPVADALVGALAANNLPAYATLVHTMPQLPPALAALQKRIQTDKGSTVSEILMATIRPEAKLRKAFSLKAAAPSGKADRQQTVFRNMANGAGEYCFDLPGLALTGFMADLFRAITANFTQILFNERDLFHGHIVPNEAGRDLVIIFHAKEFPSEECPSGKRDMWRDLNLLSNIANFDLDSPMMARRNFIWTLSTNKIFLLSDPNRTTPSTADPNFAKLIQLSSKNTLEAQDRKAGTVQELYFGVELLTVNYFPNHLNGTDDDQVFFTPNAGGGWGPLLYLESLYPNIDPKVIEKVYLQTDTSLVKTKDILSTM